MIELLSSAVEVGHCVIINDCDQPCGKLVAVVCHVQDDLVVAKYLSASIKMNVCKNRRPDLVMPVGRFGVKVVMVGDQYWCEKIGESTAVYPDGKHRPWQEYDEPHKQFWKPGVQHLAMGAILT